MDKTEKLKNLFDEWKNAHNEESDKKNTMPIALII